MEAVPTDTLATSPTAPLGISLSHGPMLSGVDSQDERVKVQQLITLLGHEDPVARWEAGRSLAQTAARLRQQARKGRTVWNKGETELTFSGLLRQMGQALGDENPLCRAAAADALSLWNHERAALCLVGAMSDAEPMVRVSVVSALGKLCHDPALDQLASALEDDSLWVRRAAADALGAIVSPRAVPALKRALGDPSPLVRASVVNALAHVGTRRARKSIEAHLQDDAPQVRWYAARALGRMGTTSSWIRLQDLLKAPSKGGPLFGKTVSQMARAAIEQIEIRERAPLSRLRRAIYKLGKRSPRGK